MHSGKILGVSLPVVMTIGAMSLLPVGSVMAAPVVDNLLYQFDPYSDTDPLDGWTASVKPSGATGTLPYYTTSGGPTHVTSGPAQYFHTSNSNTAQAFTSNLGAGNLGATSSYSSWSLELWIRRTGQATDGSGEQGVFSVSASDVGNFIFLSANDTGDPATNGRLTLDHKDRRSPANRDILLLEGTDLTDGAFHHVVVTYSDAEEGSAYGALKVYFDGNTTPVFQRDASSPSGKPTVDNSQFGSSFNTMSLFATTTAEAARYFHGDLGVVRFYTDVLTGEEANQNYSDQAATFIPEPTAAILPAIAALGLLRRNRRK